MSEAIGSKLWSVGDDEHKLMLFFCPGCKCTHPFTIIQSDPRGPCWSWNGDGDCPTFSPSLLCHPAPPLHGRCHLHLRDGQIQFCSDCDHDLAGQTVQCPDFRRTEEREAET